MERLEKARITIAKLGRSSDKWRRN